MKLRSATIGTAMLATLACSDRATYRAPTAFRTNTPSQSEGIVRSPDVNSPNCKEIFNGAVLVKDKTSATLATPVPVSVAISSIRMSNILLYDRDAADLQITFDGQDTRRIVINSQNNNIPLTYGIYTFKFSRAGIIRAYRDFVTDDIVGHVIVVCVTEQKPSAPPPLPQPVVPAHILKPKPEPTAPKICKPCAACNGGINVNVNPVITANTGNGTVNNGDGGEAKNK